MTMNTRQSGAFTEAIKKEERSRELWAATHGVAYAAKAAETARIKELAATMAASGGNTNGAVRPMSARPLSARPGSARTMQLQQQQRANGADTARPLAAASFTPRFVAPSTQQFANAASSSQQQQQQQQLRFIEVPTGRTRQVAFPVRALTTISVLVPRQIRRVVGVDEVDSFTEREIEYEEVRQVPYTQTLMREERVVKKQMVQVPCKRLVERETWETIQVPEERTVEIQAMRTEEMQEMKIVDTGRNNFRPISARQSYTQLSPQQQQQQPTMQFPQSMQRPITANNAPRGSSSSSAIMSTQQLQAFYPQPPQPQQQPQSSFSSTLNTGAGLRLGFKVRSSTIAPGVCSVFAVDPLSPAARAGLITDDLVLSVNGQRTATLTELKDAVTASRGPILLQVKRGANRMLITMQR